MARFVIDEPVKFANWEELRPRLESAIASMPAGYIAERWEEEALYLEGWGVDATIRMVEGRFRVEADLSPPASFFRSVIEEKLREALREVS